MDDVLLHLYFWVALVAMNCLNAGLTTLQRRAKGANPRDEAQYRMLLKRYLLWSNVPFLLMGILVITKRAEPWQLLEVHKGNPYAILWMSVWGAILAMGARWVFLGGGELLAQQGLLSIKTARDAKLLAAMALAVWLIMLVVDLWGPFRRHS